MYKSTSGRVTFLVNLMFCILGKFDGLIFREREGEGHISGGGWLVFGILIGLHVWGRDVYSGGILTGFYSIPVLKA